MKCCVLSCKNYSDRRSDESMNGITFHLFPSEEKLRQQWITKINRQNWSPKKHTKICSSHFNDTDFFMTLKGLRKLKKNALPCLQLDLLHKRKSPEPRMSPPRSATSDLNEFLILHDTPRKLKQHIAYLRWKAKEDKLKIKKLEMKVLRLKRKMQINVSDCPANGEIEEYTIFEEEEVKPPASEINHAISGYFENENGNDEESNQNVDPLTHAKENMCVIKTELPEPLDTEEERNISGENNISGESGDEFKIYGDYVASQLRQLSTEESLVARDKIQSILTQSRLNDLERKKACPSKPESAFR